MKFFILIFLVLNLLHADNFSTRYDVEVGMFGTVGYADITISQDTNSYEILLTAKTVGTAAMLTSNRVETYLSKGNIIDGKYIPNIFIKTKNSTGKTKTLTYTFDHDKKEVTLLEEKTKLVQKSDFNPFTFEVKRKTITKKFSKTTILDDYKDNDVLSSYLNTNHNCSVHKKVFSLAAIGARNDRNNITLECLEDSKKSDAIVKFSDGIEDIYNLHVQPFDKNKETVDVLVAYDNDGLLKEAILGEVFWIGQITAKRIYHQVTRK